VASMIERERKFLVARLPRRLKQCAHRYIRQGYLAIESEAEFAEVRLRRTAKCNTLTVKQGRGSVRLEVEMRVPAKHARKLWRLTRARRIEKVRYEVPHDGLTIEVDVYRGNAQGLVVAEVEFDSESAARRFDPPSWFGKEVTGRKKFSNSWIATRGWNQNRRSR
jgi:adenylate cyclase